MLLLLAANPCAACGLPIKPGNVIPVLLAVTCRYAVVVSFYVILTGLDPEDVVVQVGGWVQGFWTGRLRGCGMLAE